MVRAELPPISEGPKTSLLRGEMQYQGKGLGYFPTLQNKVKHVITWGPGFRNMSEEYGLDREFAAQRTQEVMTQVGMATLHNTMRIFPGIPAQQEILEVSQNILAQERRKGTDARTRSNFIYTTDPSIALSVKPADCAVSIIHAILPNGKPLLGLLHSGRKQVDELLPTQVITHLKSLGCKMENITIGIAPSAQNYFMTNDTLTNLTNLNLWREEGFLKENPDNGVTYLNISGFLLKQFSVSGISPENIEIYSIDTQKAATQTVPESFSHSESFYRKDPALDGRFLVAAQLERK